VSGARIALILILVTTAARAREVAAIGGRIFVLGGKNIVFAVTSPTSFRAKCRAVDAFVIGAGIVARLAWNGLDGLGMRSSGGIKALVAIDATHRSMSGVFEDILVDI
jgi:hypothetical protein